MRQKNNLAKHRNKILGVIQAIRSMLNPLIVDISRKSQVEGIELGGFTGDMVIDAFLELEGFVNMLTSDIGILVEISY